MICETCKKTIRVNDWYFQVKEYKNKKVIYKYFCHKSCQDEFDKVMAQNMVTPEQKEAVGKLLAKSFEMVKQLQQRGLE
jgi:hypothetical protein